MTTRSPIRRLAMLVGGGPAPRHQWRHQRRHHRSHQPRHRSLRHPGRIRMARQSQHYSSHRPVHQSIRVRPTRQGGSSRTGCATFADSTSTTSTPIYSRGGSILGTSRTNPTKKKRRHGPRSQGIQHDGVSMPSSASAATTPPTPRAGSTRASREKRRLHPRCPCPPRPSTTICPCPAPRRPLASRPPAITASASSAAWPRTHATTSRWVHRHQHGTPTPAISRSASARRRPPPARSSPRSFGLDDNKKPNTITLKHLCDIMLGSIIKRHAEHDRFGVIVLAEGLIESVKNETQDDPRQH